MPPLKSSIEVLRQQDPEVDLERVRSREFKVAQLAGQVSVAHHEFNRNRIAQLPLEKRAEILADPEFGHSPTVGYEVDGEAVIATFTGVTGYLTTSTAEKNDDGEYVPTGPATGRAIISLANKDRRNHIKPFGEDGNTINPDSIAIYDREAFVAQVEDTLRIILDSLQPQAQTI